MSTGFENLSDEELDRLLQSGQFAPVNAQTGQPLAEAQASTYRQLGQVGGLDPNAAPGSARMPRAQMRAQDQPPPGEFYVTPDGKVVQAPKASPIDRALENVNLGVRAGAGAVPFLGAYTDEANAATAATLAPMLEPALRNAPGWAQRAVGYDPSMEIGQLPTWQARYDASKGMQRLVDDAFDERHPIASGAAKVAGAVGGTLAGLELLTPLSGAAAGADAGLLMRSGAAGVEGATLGSLDGYGRGEGAWDDPSRLKGAGGGALIGGALGAAAPVAFHVGGQAWRATGGRAVDAMRGRRLVQGGDNANAEALAEAVRAAPERSVTRTPAEANLAVSGQPELSARASDVDDAWRRIAQAMSRGRITPDEAVSRTESLGPFGVLADVSPATQDLLRAAVNRPGKGATIASQNLRPRQEGVFNKATGEYDIRPSSLRIVDQAAEGLGVGGRGYHETGDAILSARKAASGPAYDKAYEAPPVDIGEFRDFVSSPLFKQAYGRAVKISEKEFVTLPDGSEVIQPLPRKWTDNEALDWRTLDLMKQGLDDLVKEGKVQGIGANEQGAIKGYLSRFVSKLDTLNPDYRAAREAFSGPTSMLEALEEGRAMLREDAYTIGKRLGEMTPAEQEMVRLGSLQELQNKLGNANVTFDAANQAGLLKPNQLARFRELFPSREAFSDFITTLENERAMFGTNTAAFGNSTTAKQILNVMEPSDPQLEGAGQALTGVAQANPMALIQAIRRMGMESPMRESVAETIASALTNVDKRFLPEAGERMRAAAEDNARRAMIRRLQATGAAQSGASVNRPGN